MAGAARTCALAFFVFHSMQKRKEENSRLEEAKEQLEEKLEQAAAEQL